MGQPAPADDQGGDPDGDVDQEHPPPTGGDQQAADDRADAGGHPAGRGPRADRAGAARRFVGGEHQPERGRGQQRSPGCLHQPEADQHLDARRCRAGGGRGGEDGDAEQEPVVTAVAVREPPEEHQQRRVDDGVPVEHPGQSAQVGRAEIAGDLRQGDVDDEQVEAGEDDAGAHDQQHLARRCLPWCRGRTVANRGEFCHGTDSRGSEFHHATS